MNAMVNRKPGSATFSGVRLAPTLAPRALNSIARNCASGFKGEKVSLVYRFVYSATSERQSSCSLGSQKLTATRPIPERRQATSLFSRADQTSVIKIRSRKCGSAFSSGHLQCLPGGAGDRRALDCGEGVLERGGTAQPRP